MSISGLNTTGLFDDAVAAAVREGVLMIAAAGNLGQFSNPGLVWPARYPEVIAVGATNRDGDRTSYSSVGDDGGPTLDIMAPGGESDRPPYDESLTSIIVADIEGEAGRSPRFVDFDPDYTPKFVGTSASAPYAAGVAALVLSINPDLISEFDFKEEVRGILTSTASPEGCDEIDPDYTYAEECGAGRVDAFEALKLTIEDYGATLRQSFAITEDWTITSDVDLRGIDLTIAAGATVTLDGGTLNLGNEDDEPSKIIVQGSLVGAPGAGSTITCEGGGEIVVRDGGFLDKEDIDISMVCDRGCLLANPGGRIHFGPGTHTFSNGAFLVNAGGTMTFAPGAEVVMEDFPGESYDRLEATPGSVFRFGAGAHILVHSRTKLVGTAAAPIIFEGDGLAPGERWAGLTIEGDSAEVTHAEIRHAGWGIELRARAATFDYLTLDGSGLLTDYDDGDCTTENPAPCYVRSSLTIKRSSITGNASSSATTGHGLVLRNTNATVTDTEVSGNDGHGVVVWNADAAYFRRNTVTGNGKDGIYVLSGGAIELAEPGDTSQPTYGRNRVSGNADDQLSVVHGGQLFVGLAASSENTIAVGHAVSARAAVSSRTVDTEPVQRSGPNVAYLIENTSGSTVFARNSYWGSTTGPDSTVDFKGAVDFRPFYTSDPIPTNTLQANTLQANTLHKSSPTLVVQGRGGLDWLGDAVRAVRAELVAAPDSSAGPELVRLLYGLQRLDRDDEQGEYGQTMAVIAERRLVLDDPGASAALRATGEAALSSEVSEALVQEVYDEAGALLVEYNPEVHSDEERLTLILSAVSVLEQAGQYGAALARVADAQALLGPEDEELSEELDWIAEIIAARALDGSGGGAKQANSERSETAASVASRGGDASVPAEYALRPAYPNPTSRGATVPFELPEVAKVRVVVYDLLGRAVAVLAEGLHEAGRHEAAFEASRLSSGVYLIRAEIAPAVGAAQVFTQKLTLLR